MSLPSNFWEEFDSTHDMCGWLDVNGSRFNVNDKTNDFGDAQYGGGKTHIRKQRQSKQKVKNYVPYKE